MADIELQGYDKILYKLNQLCDLDGVKNGMGKACSLVEGEAKHKAPKDTGALRRSITSKVEVDGDTIDGIIYTPLEYAPYVEYGTGLFAENGNGRQTPWLYEDDKGETHFTHGQHPQPYMRPALNENRQKVVELIKEGLIHD